MSETAVESLSMNELPVEPDRSMTDEQLISMLVNRARSEGLQLTGEGGLLQQLTKRVLESALEGEITDHLGYDRHDLAGKNSGNSRNGTRSKTVVTDVGPVQVRVPRDVAGTFEPQLVRKRQRRRSGVDEMVLSLSAKGLTHGEISAHLAEVYGANVSKQTISTITDKVMDGMAEWQNRPLKPCTRSCSWTRSTSRSETVTSPTGPSTWSWPSPSRGTVTSWASGPATAVRVPSTGWRY
ncbi:hypothetical protein GCM10009734_82400 [Nonomuraea bangladeshensis]